MLFPPGCIVSWQICANRKCGNTINGGEELTEENGGWDGYVWGDTREEYIEVRRAFLTMDEEDRMIVGMHVFGGYKTREIAQILAMNENTVRSREHRALQRMEKQLKGLR